VLTACPSCGELLDVGYDFNRLEHPTDFAAYLSQAATRAATVGGVWAFKELLPFYQTEPSGRAEHSIVSIQEGRTTLQRADALAGAVGFEDDQLFLQYEGFNPSGSFKDNGMAAGFTHARMVGARVVACASTGNTSASLAVYAAQCSIKAIVFIGEGKIAFGKLSQALDYGATTLQVAGDFDSCLARVRAIAEDPANGVYLLNSVNPFRLEGQKTIMFRVLRDLMLGSGTPARPRVRIPNWIVVPGGNLGNCSAFAKAFIELHALGLIERIPRLAVINAAGARTLDRVYNDLRIRWTPAPDPLLESWPASSHARSLAPSLLGGYDRAAVSAELARMDRAGEKAHTIASAIEINRPVNLAKALRALWAMNGVVRSVDDQTILEHKAMVGRYGYGCEPASAASVAGAAMLRREGVIGPNETVVCILTGHQLKDPDSTVTYHTGVDTKSAQEHIGPEHRRDPTGRLANRPIRVADDLQAIKRAMGL
jgi:threonine synthase